MKVALPSFRNVRVRIVLSLLVSLGYLILGSTSAIAAVNISTSPSSLDFREVAKGTSKTRTITIKNNGSENLKVQNVYLADNDKSSDFSEYRIVSDNASGQTIAPGSSRAVKVSFRPKTVASIGKAQLAGISFTQIDYIYGLDGSLTMKFSHWYENNGGSARVPIYARADSYEARTSKFAIGGEFYKREVRIPAISTGCSDPWFCTSALEVYFSMPGNTYDDEVGGYYASGAPVPNLNRYPDAYLKVSSNAPNSPKKVSLYGVGVEKIAPRVYVFTPSVSSNKSKTPTFKVRWFAKDESGVDFDSYVVKYKPDNSSIWRFWKRGTSVKQGRFKGRPGRTYKFKVWAKDRLGNRGSSKVKQTIVPYNEGTNIVRRRGFSGFYQNSASEYYKGTVRYSRSRGNSITYRFKAKSLGLVATKGNRSRAKIFIDGNYTKTIDARSSSFKPRRLIFNKSWARKGTHTIKIVNLATSGRRRFDVDGIAVGR